MPIAINLAGVEVQGSFEPIPRGLYPVTITKATSKTSKKGNPVFELEMAISEDASEFANRKLWFNLTVIASTLWKVKKTMLQMGWTAEQLDGGLELDEEEWVGLEAIADVRQKVVDGVLRNQVEELYSPENSPEADDGEGEEVW